MNNFNWSCLIISPINNESYSIVLLVVLSVIDSINVLSGVKDCTCNDLCCVYKVNREENVEGVSKQDETGKECNKGWKALVNDIVERGEVS